ncbi:phosphorylase [Aerosakkonema sp. BLCC-F183]|uniref:ATP adenylyltransferase family protein n=1 Tax=Aerosakkonema sp. BLCC-F183 TaxID=3342834 RepID=UPI0035BBDB93
MPKEMSISSGKIQLEPGILWDLVIKQTERGINCGALETIPTEYEYVEAEGINFLVRIISNLVRKDAAKKSVSKNSNTSSKEFNPFLPYDKDLFVTDISDTHLCLLNKFNVVEHHLLIVTRAFEEQESLLTLEDFEAMWVVLDEIDGLAFYNSGKIAGASQRHKHLQWVPLPLSPSGEKMPIAPMLGTAIWEGVVERIPSFPFVHALVKFDRHEISSPQAAAKVTLECYLNLLRAVGLLNDRSNGGNSPTGAYNLLSTREWMLIVPRSQEHFQSIPINSLGFAGALLVRNEEQMKVLKEFGPLEILKSVAIGQQSV